MSGARTNPAQANAAGSLSSGEPAFLAVGKLRHAHGVRGEILMEVLTDFPERIQAGSILYVGQDVTPMKLVKSRPHREGLLLTFEGYTTPEAISQFRNQPVFVPTEDRPPLEEGEYYHHQLIGLRVVTLEGEALGNVAEIMETGASDILVVRMEMRPDLLIPIVDEFVRQIDLAGQQITVQLIPGMRPEEA